MEGKWFKMEEKRVKKLFFAWGMDKEKVWLESMAKEGWILKSVGFGSYTFYKDEPRDIVYEFDFNFLSRKQEAEYLSYFEDWNHVGTIGSWYYFFRERKDDMDLSIFNNNDSIKRLYRRLLLFLVLFGFPMYYIFLILIPGLGQEVAEFPKFYFFFRLLMIPMLIFYSYALLRVFINYIRLNKRLKE
jgi:hypothetical protein